MGFSHSNLVFSSIYLFLSIFGSISFREAFQPLKIFPLFLKNLKLMVISCQGEPYWENHGSIGLYRNHKITSPWESRTHKHSRSQKAKQQKAT